MDSGKLKSVCQVRIYNCHLENSRLVINAMRGSQPVEYGTPLLFIPSDKIDIFLFFCYIYFVLRIKRYFTLSVDVYLDPRHFGMISKHYELFYNSVYFIFDRYDDNKEK